MSVATLSRLKGVADAWAAVGLMIGLQAIWTGFSKYEPYPWHFFPYASLLRPLALFIVIALAATTVQPTLAIVGLLASLLQIPFVGDRSGGGITDASLAQQIYVAQLNYASSILFDISAIAFIAASLVTVIASVGWRRCGSKV